MIFNYLGVNETFFGVFDKELGKEGKGEGMKKGNVLGVCKWLDT